MLSHLISRWPGHPCLLQSSETVAKSGLSQPDATSIVRIVRDLRESDAIEFAPTVRGAMMIAKALKVRKGVVARDNPVFRQVCIDILSSETSRVGSRAHHTKAAEVISNLIGQHCPVRPMPAEEPPEPQQPADEPQAEQPVLEMAGATEGE